MDEKSHVRTTVYLRAGLYAKLRGTDINLSEIVNQHLETLFDGPLPELARLITEEKQLVAKLMEVGTKIAAASEAAKSAEQAESTQEQREANKGTKRRDDLAHEITKIKPDFFLSGRPFDKFTTEELEAAYKKLAPRTSGKKEAAHG